MTYEELQAQYTNANTLFLWEEFLRWYNTRYPNGHYDSHHRGTCYHAFIAGSEVAR